MLNDIEKKLTVINPKSIPDNNKFDAQTKIETRDFEAGIEEYSQEKTNILGEQAREFRIRNNILIHYSKSLKKEEMFRKKYSRIIISLVCIYIAIVLLILIFNKWLNLGIADNVLMALVGSTSVNVVGLVTIIVRFIFTNHHHKILDGK